MEKKELMVVEPKKLTITEKALRFFKKEKVAIIAGSLAGVTIFLASCSNKESKPKTSDDIAATITEIDETSETKQTINADNIDEIVANIAKSNQEKGLSISEEKIKSALFITNINNFESHDLYELFGKQLDGVNEETKLSLMLKEIQNFYDYTSAVRTHNNNGREYVTLTNLVYNDQDKAIINELDTEYKDLVKGLSDMKEKEYQESFKYITEFYLGNGYLTIDGNNYQVNSLTAGGGLLAEAYFPMLSVVYAKNDLITKDNINDIKALSQGTKNQDAIINGSRYLGSIISVVNNCETEKTLTK